MSRVRERHPAKDDLDALVRFFQPRRTRVVPDRFLSRTGLYSLATYHRTSQVFLRLYWCDRTCTLTWGVRVSVERALRRATYGPTHRAVERLFHTVMMLVTVYAYQYFQKTTATLGYGTIPGLDEIEPILLHGIPLSVGMLPFAALVCYAVLGPSLLTRVVRLWRV